MNEKQKDILKVTTITVVILMLVAAVFVGVNSISFAMATQPETLPLTDEVNAYEITQLSLSSDQSPQLAVLWNDNEGYPNNQPKAGSMTYEEAAQIGAQYILDMYGESIDGKTVEMLYSAWPFSSRSYWHGTVVNSADDLKLPEDTEFSPLTEDSFLAASDAEINVLYSFSIDAVTGERVSISPHLNIPEPADLGEGKSYTMSPAEMEALQYEAPENVYEYAAVARAFAQKHFNHSEVVSVDFQRISLNQGNRAAFSEYYDAYREAYKAGKDEPFTFTLYDKGRSITFNVTDDTGRVAHVDIYMDTKQVTYLDTAGSDYIPGYTFEGEEEGIG